LAVGAGAGEGEGAPEAAAGAAVIGGIAPICVSTSALFM
jgi:hypothetical protein